MLGVHQFSPACSPSLAERLYEAFAATDYQKFYQSGSQWDRILARQTAIIRHITEKGPRGVADIVAHPHLNDLHYGFDQTAKSLFDSHANDATYYERYVKWVRNQVIKLAQCLAIIPMANPERTDFKYDFDAADVDTLCTAIENKTSLSLRAASVYKYSFGLQTCTGIHTDRTLSGFYTVMKAMEATGKRAPRILEIGGGSGYAAYYASINGVRDYSIVDLPLTALAQGFYLSTALGEDAVTFGNEPPQPGKIRLLPPDTLFEERAQPYDAAVNVDSITEMGRETAQRYVSYMDANCAAFLSTNHEWNPYTVPEIMAGAASLKPVSRCRNWLREGYADEVFSRG